MCIDVSVMRRRDHKFNENLRIRIPDETESDFGSGCVHARTGLECISNSEAESCMDY